MGNPAHATPAGEQARSGPAPQRLLIPIDATEASRRGVPYAIALARQVEPVEVCLLYVVAPVRDWEVLRFRTEQEIHRHFQSLAERFLAEASAPLKAAGIPCKACFREQEPVFGILDLAEQLECTAIVLPRPDWLDFRSSGLVRRLKRARRPTPVILVAADGSVAQ